MGNSFNTLPPSLPQNDMNELERVERLVNVRQLYQLEQNTFGLKDIQQRKVDIVKIPPMLRALPCKEIWTLCIFVIVGLRYLFFWIYQLIYACKQWTVQTLINHMSSSRILHKPIGCEVWRTEQVNAQIEIPTQLQRGQADHWFAWQRLNGVTRNLIRRATVIPPSFAPFVAAIQDNHPYLDGLSLKAHIENRNLFLVDLTEVGLENPRLLAPIALFVVQNNMLMPAAIRLNLNNGPDLFLPPQPEGNLPQDLQNLQNWNKAKMWFNMLEAQYHESVTHLGFTHLLMDGVSVCLHRNVSERHPVYKLMVPHFRFMHQINKLAAGLLLKADGYVDKDMYYNREDMLRLISICNTVWQLNLHGSLLADMEDRQVMNLPGYFFRDDALRIRGAIEEYVEEYIANYYGNDEAVLDDEEIQGFHAELIAPRLMVAGGGCGMQGVPEFNGIPNLVQTLTNFIYICSVEHSATNFPQYEQYGFLPNFPATLKGQPEEQNGPNVLNLALPNGRKIFSTIKMMKVLTTVLTNSLGNYESSYMNAMDDNGRNIVLNFQQALTGIGADIDQRNAEIVAHNLQNVDEVQEYPYSWLLPENVLNSISI